MALNSPFPPLRIPDQDVWDFLFDRPDAHNSEKVLFTSEDLSQRYTASAVRETALRFGDALQRHFSWRKGHVLAVVSANSVHLPPVIWGTLYIGGIVSPASHTYGSRELEHQLRDSGASAIVTQQPFLPAVLKAASAIGIPHGHIVLLPDARTCTSPFAPTGDNLEFSELVQSGRRGPVPRARLDPRTDIAFLVYSSGTTGLPKGVELTHRNIVSNVLMFDATSSINQAGHSEDVVLAFLPFYHIYGLTILMHHPFHKRARVVVMPRFELSLFCKAIESHRVSVAYIVPPVAAQLAQSSLPAQHDLSSIKYMTSGAAPLSDQLCKALFARWGLKLVQGYGLSETSPAVFMMCLDDFPTAMDTVGRLLPNQQIKLLDIDDSTIQVTVADHPGEICVRGPNVFRGYHNNDSATRAAFTPDGFFRTGDVGVIDAFGYMRITDRIKELIKYKGFQVAPAELEGLLLGHDAVAD
ncbi:hypothetical protein B7463_g12526, partial [Scytalidium lignicola]